MPFITKKGYILLLPYLLYVFYKAYINTKNGSKSPFNISLVLWSLLISTSAFLLSDWLGYELKNLIKKPRPCNTLEDVILLVGCSKSYSMPSNHAINSMAVATTLFYFNYRYVNRFIAIYPILLAMIIIYSRVYVGVHYPSDVLAGASLGIAISFFLIATFRYASLSFKKKPHETILYAFILILSAFRIYYILHGPIDLSPDEAHYWEWSRRPDLSYYSKGPMVAYLILLGTSLFGNNIMGIRVMAVIFSSLSSIFLFKLVIAMNKNPEQKELYSSRALLSALLFQIIPLFSPFGVIFTIDPPFVFFWILSLYLFWKAVEVEKGSTLNWILLGLSTGFGLLTKYTMAFFFICAFLFLLFSNKRYLLKKPMPYLSLAISLILFSPVIIWNYRYGWLTLKHTAGQAHISAGLSISLLTFLEFIGSQIGVITPFIFFMMFYAFIKIKEKKKIEYPFLLYFSIPVIAFFVLKSLHAKVQANWAMTGYITAIIAFSSLYLMPEPKGLFRFKNPKLTIVAISLPLFVTAIAHYPSIINLPAKLDPTMRLKGWKELGMEVSKIYEEMPDTSPIFLFSDRYQVSSELAFYVNGQPRTYCINNGRRMNQYDLWPDINSEAEKIKSLNKNIQINGIYVRTGNGTIPSNVEDAFDSCEKRAFSAFDRGKRLIREYSIFICYNFKGLKNPKPDRF